MAVRTLDNSVTSLDWSDARNKLKLVECIDWSFEWMETDEGHKYWKRIAVQLARVSGMGENEVKKVEERYR